MAEGDAHQVDQPNRLIAPEFQQTFTLGLIASSEGDYFSHY
jgi:hypothetical protein